MTYNNTPLTLVIHALRSGMDKEQIRIEKQEIAARLETIYEQIKNYPSPIAGYDEQFNFVLAHKGPTAANIRTTIRIP